MGKHTIDPHILVHEMFSSPHFPIHNRNALKIYDIHPNPSQHYPDLSVDKLQGIRLLADKWLVQMLGQVYTMTHPHSQDPHVFDHMNPTLFIALNKSNHAWQAYCDRSSLQVGMCTSYPIPSWSKQLHLAFRSLKRMYPNARLLATHVNIEWYDHHEFLGSHANTLILDVERKNAYLFDPRGRADTAKHALLHTLTQVVRRIGMTFKGYITPHADFQRSNEDLCFIWTTWVECLARWNPFISIDKLKKYLHHKERTWLRASYMDSSAYRHFALAFSSYLQDVSSQY